MRFGVVCHLITHSWLEGESPAIFQFCVELTFDAEKDMAFHAPMICAVARRVFDHADSNAAEFLGAPEGRAALSFVFGGFNLRPVRYVERDIRNLHDPLLCSTRLSLA